MREPDKNEITVQAARMRTRITRALRSCIVRVYRRKKLAIGSLLGPGPIIFAQKVSKSCAIQSCGIVAPTKPRIVSALVMKQRQ